MKRCLEYINEERTHVHLRNLVMMVLLPKKLHFDGEHQAAYLRAAVSRVRNVNFISNIITKIANQTVLEQEGLYLLRPVYELLFEDDDYLYLSRSSVNVYYRTYYNTFKGNEIKTNDLSLQIAVDQELTPGKIYTAK